MNPLKRVIVITVLISLLVDMSSCYSTKKLSAAEEYEKYKGNEKVRVISAQTVQGKAYEFSEKYPAKFTDQDITGYPVIKLRFNMIDSVYFNKKEAKAGRVWAKGMQYQVISQDMAGYVCLEPDPVILAVSDISQLKLMKPDPIKSIFLISGIAGVITGTFIWMASNLDFNYSY
jgi:hypothetical protein